MIDEPSALRLALLRMQDRANCAKPAPLHPIRRYKGGPYGTQRIQMVSKRKDCDLGYYKIWYFGPEGRRVIDRAMSVKRARAIINQLGPLV